MTEAVIEELALYDDIKGEQGLGSYYKERVALAELRRFRAKNNPSEIPLAIFVDALFSHQPLGEKLEKNRFIT